jgi:hypothetical protein
MSSAAFTVAFIQVAFPRQKAANDIAISDGIMILAFTTWTF